MPAATHHDPQTRAFLTIWIIVGAVIISTVVFQLMGILSSVLMFLAVGLMVAFLESPIVNWLERRHVPRGLGSIIGLIAVVASAILVFALLIPLFLGQLTELFTELPRQFSGFGAWLANMERRYEIVEHVSAFVQLDALLDTLQNLVNDLAAMVMGAVRDGFVPFVNNIAQMVFVVFLSLVFAYWIACDYPRINNEICSVLPQDKADDFRLMLAVVSRSVGGYLRSMAINSCIQGLLAFAGFALVGHPYAGIMGVLSGILNFIPIVGPTISAVLATLIALVYSPLMAFLTIIVAVLSQNITDNVIAPKINQSTMQIHPVLSLTALMIGSAVLGTLGMIIAIPLCATLKSLFIFYFETRTNKQIVTHAGALFRGVPYLDKDGNPVPAYDALGDDRFAFDSEIVSVDEMPSATVVPRPVTREERLWATVRGDARPPHDLHELLAILKDVNRASEATAAAQAEAPCEDGAEDANGEDEVSSEDEVSRP